MIKTFNIALNRIILKRCRLLYYLSNYRYCWPSLPTTVLGTMIVKICNRIPKLETILISTAADNAVPFKQCRTKHEKIRHDLNSLPPCTRLFHRLAFVGQLIKLEFFAGVRSITIYEYLYTTDAFTRNVLTILFLSIHLFLYIRTHNLTKWNLRIYRWLV